VTWRWYDDFVTDTSTGACMTTRRSEEVAKEKLIDSVKSSLTDAENLLREAASSSGDKANELRDRAIISLKRTREALYDAQDAVLERGRKAARATDDYVHDNPWQAIGIAGVTGLLLGLLIARR
jgi:ElaB/YqjD/DUF883 family membrane-anchored ribosome-binding protein